MWFVGRCCRLWAGALRQWPQRLGEGWRWLAQVFSVACGAASALRGAGPALGLMCEGLLPLPSFLRVVRACTTNEEQVEQSQLVPSDRDEEKMKALEIDNRREFEALQKHPIWGHSFKTFGEGSGRSLVIGKSFAKGAEGELFEAQVKWKSASKNNRQWVLKVFKKGTFLRDVRSHWPHEWFGYRAETARNTSLRKARPTTPRLNRYVIGADYVVLLDNGRFGFLMRRADGDLHELIKSKMSTPRQGSGPFSKLIKSMMSTPRQGSGPFSKEVAEDIMYDVALSMAWLHSRNIVHRDVKPANVLFIRWDAETFGSFVADFDSSRGVTGTSYFRAPEILKACKEKNHRRPEIYTKAVDVYSYGMTCYEILTGKLPFQDDPTTTDLVVNGNRPEVPEYVDEWIRELLHRCWEQDPAKRPTFVEIMCLFEAHSAVVRKMITDTGLDHYTYYAKDGNFEHQLIERWRSFTGGLKAAPSSTRFWGREDEVQRGFTRLHCTGLAALGGGIQDMVTTELKSITQLKTYEKIRR